MVFALNGFGSNQTVNLAKSDYHRAVKDYKGCITRQINTKSSNDKATILKEFLTLAGDARIKAGNTFKHQYNSPEARVNLNAGHRELKLAGQVKNSIYVACNKPETPSGVSTIKLPPAPYNKLVPG